MTATPPDSDRYAFYTRVEGIQGWLNRPAGLRTIDILRWQDAQRFEGNFLEIGVFCGKYFSLLVERAIGTGGMALGIDTFEFATPRRVHDELAKMFGPDAGRNYMLWSCPSSSVHAGEIVEAVGRPRFISVDGAHDYENVFRDLVLAESVLGADGIIAVDDFLNPLTLGVNQAVNAFLAVPRRVVPVAYISNKLFLAQASREDQYRAAIEEMILQGTDLQSEHFRKMLPKGRSHVEQSFFGHRVLLS